MAKVLRADDKRRNYHKVGISSEDQSTGAGRRVSALFHDRRHSSGSNGRGKRAK